MPRLKDNISDIDIIKEAARIAAEGICVTLPVAGRSMLPFIIGGKESVILCKALPPRRGDIVLAWVENRRYVIHRILDIKGDKVTLMGDGNIHGREYCRKEDIIALATHYVGTDGKACNLYTPWRKAASRLWLLLLPVRRYLLFIYRIFS